MLNIAATRALLARRRRRSLGHTLLFLLMICATAAPLSAYAQEPTVDPAIIDPAMIESVTVDPAAVESTPAQSMPATAAEIAAIDWLEPRALSVVDLVGQVPDEHLRGSILVFTGGSGILRYRSGSRDGDRVTITVDVSPRYPDPLPDGQVLTQINCLGKRALYDEWPLSVPASEMRLFSNGREITNQIVGVWLYHTGLVKPSGNAGGSRYEAYEDQKPPTQFVANGALKIPANMGCTVYARGRLSGLTAEFVFDSPQQIAVEVLGSQSFNFHSYIGAGDAGKISALAKQMASRYGGRHEKPALHVPEGADYVWFNYPPTPASAYIGGDIDWNIRQPGSGTYRMMSNGGLGVDQTISQGLPLGAEWLDADMGGGSYLRQLGPVNALGAPEYFVPPGVPFDPCMQNGGCSSALLEQIYRTTYPATIYYYRVRRLASSSLISIPLRQVGKSWSAAASADAALAELDAASEEAAKLDAKQTLLLPMRVSLPLVLFTQPPAPVTLPDEAPRAECPCGWFTADGRMLDVIPGP